MYVKPAIVEVNGVKTQLQVRDPQLMDLIPVEGRLVPDSAFWLRRLRDGDVIEAEPPPPPPPTEEVPPAPSDADPGDAAPEHSG